MRAVASLSQGPEARRRPLPAPQQIDHHGGVQEDRAHSADPAGVGTPLLPDPGCGIPVPLVPSVGHRPEGGLDQLPAPLVVERLPHGAGDERTASPRPDPPVELANQLVAEANVYSHGHKLTHDGDLLGQRPVRSELTYMLVKLDKDYTADDPEGRWEDFSCTR